MCLTAKNFELQENINISKPQEKVTHLKNGMGYHVRATPFYCMGNPGSGMVMEQK